MYLLKSLLMKLLIFILTTISPGVSVPSYNAQTRFDNHKHVINQAKDSQFSHNKIARQQSEAFLNTYKINPHHANITVAFNYMGSKTLTAGFYGLSGEVKYSSQLQAGYVNMKIPMNKLRTINETVTQYLLGKHFFNAKKYPIAEFKSTRWNFKKKIREKNNSINKLTSIDGVLTIRGITHPVRLKANGFHCYTRKTTKKQICNGSFQTSIYVKNWNMGTYTDIGIPEKMTVNIKIEARKQYNN